MLNGNPVYYPLALGYEWTYQLKDGSTYTNKVTSVNPQNPNEFTMVNSMMNKNQIIRKEGAVYFTDSYEAGTMQIFLQDDLRAGDSWEIKFKANGLDNILIMSVKETGISQTVNNKMYESVMKIEAESKLLMNGNLMPLNFFTQYYYAAGVGLVLTTSSMGDAQSLINYKIA
jgi:hypothetical protein